MQQTLANQGHHAHSHDPSDEIRQLKARIDALCSQTEEKNDEPLGRSPLNAEQRLTDPLLEEKFKLYKTLNGWVSALGGPPAAAEPFTATSAIGSNLSALEMSEAAKARPPASFPSRAVTDQPGAPYQRVVFNPVNDRVEVLQRPPGG